MGCCKEPRTSSPPRSQQSCREDILLRIPGASVHLTDGGGEVVELAKGDLKILRITDTEKNISVVSFVKVGDNLQWPLTKDEPVVKLDNFHYLFTLRDPADGSFLNYGVTFAGAGTDNLDRFLKENVCLVVKTASTPSSTKKNEEAYWKDYAPKIDDYNNILARAIAGGTGQIVKGMFMYTDAYTSQVQKGADLIQQAPSKKGKEDGSSASKKPATGVMNQSIRRVRKLSEMTEKMSEALLNGAIFISATATAPLVQSKAGKAFFSMLPGQILLATLDSVGKVMDAIEAAERRSITATGGALAGAVSKKFGDSAGEATVDIFATADHAIGTAWNVLKIRKALRPSSSVPSAMVKNAVLNKKKT